MDVAFANPPLLQSLNHEDEDRVLVSLTGAAQVTEDVVTATSYSATSNVPSSTRFTITAPGYSAILDRKYFCRQLLLSLLLLLLVKLFLSLQHLFQSLIR